jgi:hydrogenase maturation protease
MSWPQPIRVVGIGSPLGDDALGWEVVRQLQRQKWPHDIEFRALEGGQRLLEVLDGRGSLILIDALAPAGHPGMIRRFDWPDSGIAVLRPGSTHDLRPSEALELADTLGLLPRWVAIWAIEAASLDPRNGLTPKPMAAIPELVLRIGGELDETLCL